MFAQRFRQLEYPGSVLGYPGSVLGYPGPVNYSSEGKGYIPRRARCLRDVSANWGTLAQCWGTLVQCWGTLAQWINHVRRRGIYLGGLDIFSSLPPAARSGWVVPAQ